MGSFFELKSFIKHALIAKGRGGHGVHSPLMYELITQALLRDKRLYAFDEIEQQRSLLLNNHTAIEVDDLGAGSRHSKSSSRKISDIARHALQPTRSAQSLAKLVHHFRPQVILELGTSLGITTAYFSKANPSAQIFTVEGSKEIANQASMVWDQLNLKNIHQRIGHFDNQLPLILSTIGQVDFALIDGNHRYAPTVRYFNHLLPSLNHDSIVILDDIYWSKEMHQAWVEISENSAVTASVDFFHFGILFFQNGKTKEHFKLHLP